MSFGSPAAAVGRGTTTPPNPNPGGHRARRMGTPPCPPAGPDPPLPLPRLPPASHASPHLSGAISADYFSQQVKIADYFSKQIKILLNCRLFQQANKTPGSAAMCFGTPVSKIPATGWLPLAKPTPLRCSIDPSNPTHVGAEHPELMEPYGVRALRLPSPNFCFLALKMPFFFFFGCTKQQNMSPLLAESSR